MNIPEENVTFIFIYTTFKIMPVTHQNFEQFFFKS